MGIPDYKTIYTDILDRRTVEKKKECESILQKKTLSAFDIINLNKMIFSNEDNNINQKLRSYDKSDILQILDYQTKNKLNDSQLALHFKMSRNTIAKWKKLFYST